MKKEQILEAINSLPEIPAGQKPDETEIYEGEQDGTSFRVTKLRTPVVEIPFVRLTVYGPNGHEVVENFTRMFGTTPTCSFSSFVGEEEHNFDWHITTSQP